jgi:hypothetical protein
MADLPLETQGVYRGAVRLLNQSGIPFLVGGAYALADRTGVIRHTKDLDVFVRPEDIRLALSAFERGGYDTEMTFDHWLAKASREDDFIDLIFSSGNGVCKVDKLWFEFAAPAVFLGEPVSLCPVEETIWCKAFICERERFDGADVNHLLLACGRELDWQRLLWRFGPHWRVLLSHLITFGFVYPADRDAIPAWVMDELMSRLKEEAPTGRRVCQGPLLSRTQYRRDLEEWGYEDARLDSEASMTAALARLWTEAGVLEGHG